MGTDLLAPYGRNEPCWCGSKLKYKHCHGHHRPPSMPGAPLPPDNVDSLFLSPSTAVASSALPGLLPAGTSITMPTGEPTPTAITFTNWEEDLGAAVSNDEDALTTEAVGALRVEVLRRLAALPATDDLPSDDIRAGVYQLTAETVRTVAHLAKLKPRRAVLWNQELDVARFLGRTLLLADHVLYPDHVFDVLLRNGSSIDLKKAAERQLTNAELLADGIAIPVPPGVAMAQTSSSRDQHSVEIYASASW